MRTTVIPAQITTVEDKIAGNFNIAQILLLLASLFVGVLIYAALPSRLHFTLYKIPIIVAEFAVFVTLAIRVKNRIILSWLVILLGYYLRPAYYVANKNDIYLRDVILDIPVKKKVRKAVNLSKVKKENQIPAFNPNSIETILGISRSKLSFKFDKEGLNAVWQVKK